VAEAVNKLSSACNTPPTFPQHLMALLPMLQLRRNYHSTSDLPIQAVADAWVG